MTTTVVAVPPIRRWIRRAQAAHKERGERLGNFYFAVLAVLIVGGMIYRQLRAVFWPVEATASALTGASLALIVTGILFLALRRLGPLALSRPAASWLLTAPVSRRRLLLPPMRTAAVAAGLAAALGAYLVVGHAGPRPLTGPAEALLPVSAALAGAGLFLLALAAQAGRRWGGLPDRLATLAVAAGLAGLVVDGTALDWARTMPRLTTGWPGVAVLGAVAAALAVVVAAGFALAVRRIARTPNGRILEASRTAGTLADSLFGVEPSFVTDMIERRHWAGRRLRSRSLNARVPVLVAQDLLMLRRRPGRLLAVAGATTLPVLLARGPAWLVGLGVLIGASLAAATTTATVRSDAANPVLLRLLGLSSRRSVIQRLIAPAVLATVWAAVSLALLVPAGALPPGPWWLLGIAAGPVCAMAAVRRARVGFVDNSLLPLDTPMGSVSTGPLLNAVVGFDSLLFGLPTVIAIGVGLPLTYTVVLVQLVVSALGLRLYLNLTTADDRVELAEAR